MYNVSMRKKYPKKPDPIELTAEGHKKAEEKHEKLTARREVVLVELQRAREMGDLSENGAYKAARFELGDVDRELRRINHLLKYGVVVSSKNTGKVGMGSKVKIKGPSEMTVQLVSTYESDPSEMKLSVESPIGKAVMGKSKGDKAVVETPNGSVEWEILSVN